MAAFDDDNDDDDNSDNDAPAMQVCGSVLQCVAVCCSVLE